MCTDLQDLRAKITRRTHSVLFAKATATGKDISEIVRDVLSAWADEEVHAASVMARLLRDEGVLGESEGVGRDSKGMRGKSDV